MYDEKHILASLRSQKGLVILEQQHQIKLAWNEKRENFISAGHHMKNNKQIATTVGSDIWKDQLQSLHKTASRERTENNNLFNPFAAAPKRASIFGITVPIIPPGSFANRGNNNNNVNITNDCNVNPSRLTLNLPSSAAVTGENLSPQKKSSTNIPISCRDILNPYSNQLGGSEPSSSRAISLVRDSPKKKLTIIQNLAKDIKQSKLEQQDQGSYSKSVDIFGSKEVQDSTFGRNIIGKINNNIPYIYQNLEGEDKQQQQSQRQLLQQLKIIPSNQQQSVSPSCNRRTMIASPFEKNSLENDPVMIIHANNCFLSPDSPSISQQTSDISTGSPNYQQKQNQKQQSTNKTLILPLFRSSSPLNIFPRTSSQKDLKQQQQQQQQQQSIRAFDISPFQLPDEVKTAIGGTTAKGFRISLNQINQDRQINTSHYSSRTQSPLNIPSFQESQSSRQSSRTQLFNNNEQKNQEDQNNLKKNNKILTLLDIDKGLRKTFRLEKLLPRNRKKMLQLTFNNWQAENGLETMRNNDFCRDILYTPQSNSKTARYSELSDMVGLEDERVFKQDNQSQRQQQYSESVDQVKDSFICQTVSPRVSASSISQMKQVQQSPTRYQLKDKHNERIKNLQQMKLQMNARFQISKLFEQNSFTVGQTTFGNKSFRDNNQNKYDMVLQGINSKINGVNNNSNKGNGKKQKDKEQEEIGKKEEYVTEFQTAS